MSLICCRVSSAERRAAMTACRSRSTSSSSSWPPASRSTSPSRSPSRRTSRRIGAATYWRSPPLPTRQAYREPVTFSAWAGAPARRRGGSVRFAIKTRPEHTTWAQMRDVWVAADEIDLFESAWNWDHFYPLTGDLTGPNLEGWTMLAAMGQATRRIRIGCQVTGMIYRHPAVLANMAATVDIISEGRIGLGAGWNQQECDAYGIALPPLKERMDRFDEGVEVIVRLLSDTTTTFDGQYLHLTDARCEPKPVQRPHPPITIGGRGRKRTLRTAARWAQQWNAITADPGEWASLKQTLVE